MKDVSVTAPLLAQKKQVDIDEIELEVFAVKDPKTVKADKKAKAK